LPVRETLGARDHNGGLTWMFDMAEVCARFDMLDLIPDVLDNAQSALNVRGDPPH
jgi:hypothetical protein